MQADGDRQKTRLTAAAWCESCIYADLNNRVGEHK